MVCSGARHGRHRRRDGNAQREDLVQQKVDRMGLHSQGDTKLINPATGEAVTGKVTLQLRTKTGNAWKTYQTKSTASSGTVSFATKPSASMYFRTVYAGTEGFSSVATASTRITVKANGAKVLAEATKHKGARYVFGAAGPKRFDCSGYTMYVYRKAAGKKLPHKANSQQKYGMSVSKGSKKAGDLLVFRSGSYGTHVGIYAGGGYMWASPRAGKTVSIKPGAEHDAGCRVKYLIRDRDGKYPALFDAILADAGITVVLSGVRMPRMNSVMERWIQSCRHELLDRTLIWNQAHLLHALREYERHHNGHRPHRGIANARPQRPLPEPITNPAAITRLRVCRNDRLGGLLHEYDHAA
ncbi:NlpC/P60 family protein [Actinoplanes sp. NPDC049118]|uniref:NlpC/P60 family protein n=1 Tax=Actinoplanes sp. NPDC049118 TaxID=3155769 RepID=UPI0033EA3008